MHPTQKPASTAVEETFNPAQALRGAALYLERHGWIPSDAYAWTATPPAFPAATARDAIAYAVLGAPIDTTDDYLDREAHGDFEYALGVFADFLYWTGNAVDHLDVDIADLDIYDVATRWNDAPDRTAEQVITALRDAADDFDSAMAKVIPTPAGQWRLVWVADGVA
ncbi:hypothetical protein Val02_14030 [Virgisporangium aliadipatigenens]|uniref:Uncharacterized protein n=2 Tax=Virgisporangium aliadipatigenens TaxID=741659 RepID=A0A8J4DPK1_9ACTN|nr:hypothetical protein Val02_14030 [Virgisporangium aliadipatigenens]